MTACAFEQFQWAGRAHLGRDDARDVVLQFDVIDNRQPLAFTTAAYDAQSTSEGLLFSTLQ